MCVCVCLMDYSEEITCIITNDKNTFSIKESLLIIPIKSPQFGCLEYEHNEVRKDGTDVLL